MQTLEYANSELNKYYAKVVGGACGIRLKNAASGHPFDDRITIDVEKGKGTIEGSNERAVLIGVYKFFLRARLPFCPARKRRGNSRQKIGGKL